MTSSQSVSTAKKVALGLSGGVDSSVAAYLLKKEGFDVTGVYMQCWESKADNCTADEDKFYAVQSAAVLGIKYEQLDFISQYKSKVIQYFYDEYQKGRTPNPDIMCNKEIKFGLFYDWALAKGYDYVATGHYAQNIKKDTTHLLLQGVDPKKDQSYFLYLLDQEKLQRVLFPVGGLTKSKVRELAKEAQLPTFNRPDSVGICFIGEVDIKQFLKKQLPEKKGAVYFTDGERIGDHDGAWFYTIGQRHGFRVNKYFGKPLYVLSKNTQTNTLVVGYEQDITRTSFTVEHVHWIGQDPFGDGFTLDCGVRIRHLGQIYNVTLNKTTGGVYVDASEPIFGVASGQSAVFYKDTVVLGGGIIN